MKKYLITTIEPFSPNENRETRLVPAKTAREAEEKAEPYQIVISCEPYQGKAANRYIAYAKRFAEKKNA
ncbi:MAG: hypothetical protein IKL07_00465 [Clostridium sp.]|nr:hypothetical protein [Clostridium sp.]